MLFLLNKLAVREVPNEFLLFNFGDNPAYKGGIGEFNIPFDKTQAYHMMAVNGDHAVMIDYDHGAANISPLDPALSGKAAGFGKMSIKEDGLYLTDVKWTPPAEEALKNGEWQFVSPWIDLDKDKKLILQNVGLVNMPALKNNAALMMSQKNRSETMSDDKEKETQELKAELAAMKLSMKTMSAEVEKAGKIQALQEIEKMVDSAIQLGKLGKADREDHVNYGVEFGGDRLEKMLSRMSKVLPTSQRFTSVASEKEVVEEKTSDEGMNHLHSLKGVRDGVLHTIMKSLSTKDSCGAPALIKSEEDKIKLLNKLSDPKTTIERSKFFTGWGNRFTSTTKGVK